MSFSPFFAYGFLFMKGAHPSIQARTCLCHNTPDARSSPAAAAAHAHAHSFIYAHHLPINKHENPTHYHLLAHALRHTHTYHTKIDCCAAELLFEIPFLPCIYLIEPAANSPSRRFLFFIFVVFFHSREIFIQSFHHLFKRPEARNF
ncbi:hypothetical protein T02_6422 [Trichinella nativa]|uniref:Uncharacterized protein n=1 Tax=Trichinella nativa TaxID=6335 RepID=A0A0V1LIF9_9BILA|nr:hypothetical protein T02_6422 [Trichinella nativa]